jgi:hypothetical protein
LDEHLINDNGTYHSRPSGIKELRNELRWMTSATVLIWRPEKSPKLAIKNVNLNIARKSAG